MSSSTKPTYVSSSGSIVARPLAARITDTISDIGSIAYLFVETLLSPVLNPASWANPSLTGTPTPRPSGRNDGNVGSGRSLGGGGGSGGSGGGRGGGGGGGGFMSMGDLRGGGTVDGCRATCG